APARASIPDVREAVLTWLRPAPAVNGVVRRSALHRGRRHAPRVSAGGAREDDLRLPRERGRVAGVLAHERLQLAGRPGENEVVVLLLVGDPHAARIDLRDEPLLIERRHAHALTLERHAPEPVRGDE